jgi:hypothetical protein
MRILDMGERLDELLDRLATSSADPRLDGLEESIGRKIAERRRDARMAVTLAPVRVASVAIALALGVTAGGAAATTALMTPKAYGTFSAGAHLAPSTLLEGGE